LLKENSLAAFSFEDEIMAANLMARLAVTATAALAVAVALSVATVASAGDVLRPCTSVSRIH
jgi:hypothetical protein